MRLLRALVGSLLWILAGVVGLLAVLCATIILLPLGIPLLMLARRLFRYSVALFMPRKARHPVQELGRSVRDRAGEVKSSASDVTPDLKATRKAAKRARKKGRSFVKHQRRRLA